MYTNAECLWIHWLTARDGQSQECGHSLLPGLLSGVMWGNQWDRRTDHGNLTVGQNQWHHFGVAPHPF